MTNSKATFAPHDLVWTHRQPEKVLDPALMKRYGIKWAFDLGPGEHFELPLPIKTPPSHPVTFASHLVLGFRTIPQEVGRRKYETHLAEVSGSLELIGLDSTFLLTRTKHETGNARQKSPRKKVPTFFPPFAHEEAEYQIPNGT